MTSKSERLITQDAGLLGSDNVTLTQNTTDERSSIVRFTVPKKFSRLRLDTDRHETKFVPRTKESGLTVQDDSGDLYVSVTGDLTPISGETELSEQDFQVAHAVDSTGAEVAVTKVDYARDRVYLDSTAVTAGDSVDVFHVITQGNIYVRVKDVFQNVGDVLSQFGFPVRVFSELEQNNRRNRPHLSGGARLGSDETLEILFESPRQIVWEDADYPAGEYVSQIAQRVELE